MAQFYFLKACDYNPAMAIAVRQALGYSSTLRAVGVCLVGWIVQIIMFVLLFSVFGGSAS